MGFSTKWNFQISEGLNNTYFIRSAADLIQIYVMGIVNEMLMKSMYQINNYTSTQEH